MQNIISPETNQSVVEDLRELFRRIIARRKKKWIVPKYPLEEGDILDDPVGAYVEGLRGNFRPKVWEEHEIKEYRGNKCGEVEISFVCDGSGSMKDGGGQKRKEQQRAMVLAMEALKDFNDMADEEAGTLVEPIDIKTEVYKFQGGAGDSKPLKQMGRELSEKDRIVVCDELSRTQGGTTDFIPLETIDARLSDEALSKIRDGELKKIIIVMTDGESDDSRRVQNVTASLREKGVVVVGLGITSAGDAVLETYAPKALVVEDAKDLPRVLGKLLEEHLMDL
ncbi:MAG: VWA domain-containing protein [Candidatus Yonathbacteria bacterium]|nr:VWA domain-containing protein [Candidatus Yonathbacteria bacterium]